MGKPTVHDIANAAGVSLATVDRVLNGRPGVRAKTVERVNNAIALIGYTRDLSAANLARQRQYHFEFLLPAHENQTVIAFKAAIDEIRKSQSTERVEINLKSLPDNDPHEVVRMLNRLDPTKVNGVAIMAPETPQLRDAIAHLKAQGIAVVALVSDLPNSEIDHFAGINNQAAGRTAATLIGRFSGDRTGTVLVIADSMLARDSLERRLGFDSQMMQFAPRLKVLPSLETHSDKDRTTRIFRAVLSAHPDIRGVYVLGSGLKTLLEIIGADEAYRDLIVVAHDLTPFTHQALLDHAIDAVITQDVGHLVRSSLRVLRAKTDGVATIASQERIRIEIVLRENLP